MSYLTQDLIANDQHMLHRVAQCAAGEGILGDPDRWTYDNRRMWAASPGWDDAWEYSVNTHPPVQGDPPYETGKDEAVITDGMILAQVQSMLP